VASADGVETASADGQPGLLRVRLAQPDSMNAAVSAVVSAGIPLLSSELEGARLSDAFLAMTETP
jgi:ABC-2 type transport system ATP-binding protein